MPQNQVDIPLPVANENAEQVLFKLETAAAVYNGPTLKTLFTLDKPAVITKVFTYHWNNGAGATPGRISLKNSNTGVVIGEWDATGAYHMFDLTPGAVWPVSGDGPPFLYWTIQPNVSIPAGTYEVLDSGPETWSYNSEIGNMGCVWVSGRYTGATELKSDDAETCNKRGLAYKKSGNNQQSIDEYTKAIQLKPDFAAAYNNRGVAYQKMGNYQQAIDDYNKAIQLNADFAIAYYNRGLAFAESGNDQQSINDFKIAARLGDKIAQDELTAKGIQW
ncbi:MAG: tetratricopeptide repeat protein [Dissulfurispiraceae bacterium]